MQTCIIITTVELMNTGAIFHGGLQSRGRTSVCNCKSGSLGQYPKPSSKAVPYPICPPSWGLILCPPTIDTLSPQNTEHMLCLPVMIARSLLIARCKNTSCPKATLMATLLGSLCGCHPFCLSLGLSFSVSVSLSLSVFLFLSVTLCVSVSLLLALSHIKASSLHFRSGRPSFWRQGLSLTWGSSLRGLASEFQGYSCI